MELYWANLLRVLATFAVIAIHVTAPAVIFAPETTSFNWWAANFIDASVRWCVPIFVLVSGALLLDPIKKESLKRFYKNRIRRILVPLVIWSTIYILLESFREELRFQKILTMILKGEPYYHLWFVYMILGLYLFTPFFRSYVRSSSVTERYYCILCILSLGSVCSILEHIDFINTHSIFTTFLPYIGYYLCGYQLRLIDKSKIRILPLIIIILVSILCIAVGAGFFVNQLNIVKGWRFFYDYFSPPVIILSIAIFLIIYKVFHHKKAIPERINSIIYNVTPATFGIFLIHPLILETLQKVFNLSSLSYSPLLSIPLITLVTFLLSYFSVAMIMKIPYLKRIFV